QAVVVLDDNKITITADTAASVHYLAGTCRHDLLAGPACDIDAFVAAFVEGGDDAPVRRPHPAQLVVVVGGHGAAGDDRRGRRRHHCRRGRWRRRRGDRVGARARLLRGGGGGVVVRLLVGARRGLARRAGGRRDRDRLGLDVGAALAALRRHAQRLAD